MHFMGAAREVLQQQIVQRGSYATMRLGDKDRLMGLASPPQLPSRQTSDPAKSAPAACSTMLDKEVRGDDLSLEMWGTLKSRFKRFKESSAHG